MTAPVDHHYFEWSTSKQPTNHIHPFVTHPRQPYEDKRSLEENQFKQDKTTLNHTNGHIRKKQKLNGIGSTEEQNQSQTCYPFQAELTQKIDIECGGNSNNSGQTAHPPTHHFTLSTVINVSVNGQSQKSLDILPTSSQSHHYPTKSSDQQTLLPTNYSSITPYSELNLSLYLKDIDLTTFDNFILPICPNPQDYLTIDGLLTFLMSDKSHQLKHPYPMQQIYNSPQTQYYPNSYQQYPISQSYNYSQQPISTTMLPIDSYSPVDTGSSSYYRQTSLSQSTTRHYPMATPTSTFR